jgi:heat shock protein HslJ
MMTRVLACGWTAVAAAAVVVLASGGLAGCAADNHQPSMAEQAMAANWPMVAARRWRVETIDGRPLIKHTGITLDFRRSGEIAGRAGVNSYRATWERVGLMGLWIGKPAATNMDLDSPRGVMAQERGFLALLPQVNGWSYHEGQLVLMVDGKPRVTLSPDEPVPG